METTLYIDPATRDIVIGPDGDARMITGPEVTAQAVRAVLQTYKDEWFFDVDHGTDYMQLLGNYPDDLLIEDVITEAVYQVEGVDIIEDINISREGRMLGISLRLRLTTGESITVEVDSNA